MSGHYWVWIHDFEQNIWRKYIDSNVELNRNTDEVLATLNSSGEPYFLCYVRDEDKDEHVDVPRRRRPPPEMLQCPTMSQSLTLRHSRTIRLINAHIHILAAIIDNLSNASHDPPHQQHRGHVRWLPVASLMVGLGRVYPSIALRRMRMDLTQEGRYHSLM